MNKNILIPTVVIVTIAAVGELIWLKGHTPDDTIQIYSTSQNDHTAQMSNTTQIESLESYELVFSD